MALTSNGRDAKVDLLGMQFIAALFTPLTAYSWSAPAPDGTAFLISVRIAGKKSL